VSCARVVEKLARSIGVLDGQRRTLVFRRKPDVAGRDRDLFDVGQLSAA
jgi:hypothetical protein